MLTNDKDETHTIEVAIMIIQVLTYDLWLSMTGGWNIDYLFLKVSILLLYRSKRG